METGTASRAACTCAKMDADDDGNVDSEVVIVRTDIRSAQGHAVCDGRRAGAERRQGRGFCDRR